MKPHTEWHDMREEKKTINAAVSGHLLLLPENKQENEQNGGPEKPYESLMDGYYLAAPGWIAVVRFQRFSSFFLSLWWGPCCSM